MYYLLNDIERFWNIVYYFAYRADYKLHMAFIKIEPVSLLIRLLFLVPFIRKSHQKRGVTLETINKGVDEAFKCPDIGLSSFFALTLIMGGKFSFILGIFMCFPNRNFIELLIVCFIAVLLHDYIFLLHKNKYLKYFKEFDKKPRKWKVKWAWISLGVILFSFIFFLFSGLVLNPYFKNG